MKSRFLLFPLLLLLSYFPSVAAAGVTEISAFKLKEMMDAGSVHVVFPLSRIEFNNLHIPGSVHLPMEKIPEQLPADKERKLVFYCLGRG